MVLPSSRKRKGHCEIEEPEVKCPRPRQISKASLSSSSPGQIISPVAQNVSRLLKQILKAIASNKTNEVIEILESSRDSDKLTIDEFNHALYQAACYANYFLTRKLIQHGANMDFKDANEKNCLHVSAERGYLDIAKLLVSSKCNMDDVDCHGNTALILCQNSPASCNTTELLVNAHAKINIQNKAGETALMKALRNQNVQVMMLLLEFKADATLKDIEGNSAESLATDLGMGGLLKTLEDGYSRFGKTPLAKATLEQNIPQLELLLSSKVFDVNDVFGWMTEYREFNYTALSLLFSTRWMELEAPETRAKDIDNLTHKRNLLKFFSSKEMEIMTILLKAGASIHFDGGIKTTPLLMATQRGDPSLLGFLLKNESSTIPMNFDSYCKALDMAALRGRHDLVALIAPKVKSLSPKMKFKNCCGYKSPLTEALHDALSGGFKKCVDKILPLISDLDYSQAVVVAVSSGHYSVYCKMKDFQPKLFAKLVTKKDGYRWLSRACELKDNFDIVASLLSSGAKPNDHFSEIFSFRLPLTVCKSAKITKLLLQNGAKIQKSTAAGDYLYYRGEECAVVNAVMSNYPEIVKVLIKNGATVDINLLTLVLVKAQCTGKMRKLILSYSMDVNQFGYLGKTAIFHAVQMEDFDSLSSLVKKGADVNLTSDTSPSPPLIAAALNNNLQMLSFLLEHGANVDIKNDKGDTALTLSRSKASITLLSSRGANLNVVNNQGCSALRISARDNHFENFCALIDVGADVNIRCKGHTLLSDLLMDKFPKEKFIKYLLDQGGKVSDRNSMFAVHRCIYLKDYNLLSALLSSGQFCPLVLEAANPDCALPSGLVFSSLHTEKFYELLSPLCMALIYGNVSLARELLRINFLTTSDLTILPGSRKLFIYLTKKKYNECIAFLENMSHQSPTLMQLTHASVSELTGPDPDRNKRINKLGLPPVLEKSLSFTLTSQIINETDFPLKDNSYEDGLDYGSEDDGDDGDDDDDDDDDNDDDDDDDDDYGLEDDSIDNGFGDFF